MLIRSESTLSPVSNKKILHSQTLQGGNGYVFQGMDGGAVQAAVGRAMADYRERPGEWQGLVLRVLDDGDAWSWDGPTEEYLDIYSKVLA